ncbi:hypothetical protein GQ53DRAFT_671915 [Thozetella sp. PMI_491]|nr:hypothetical protein GQ53DRAFT_671915 [Thozetella sp. PMI_491]
MLSGLDLSTASGAPSIPQCPPEDQAVSQFFEKYVMYPCNNQSSPGFLEHLPVLFYEARIEGRLALRWAVRAAAYASLAGDQSSSGLGAKALKCYGLALSALGDALRTSTARPDGQVLMTVVVLDIFETVYLQKSARSGSHAEGMALVLRLRGQDQIYGPRGWSLFRLAHHRLQKQQLTFKLGPMPETDAWFDSLDEKLPYVHAEKDNHQIIKVCAKARELLNSICDADLEAGEMLCLVREMHDLDRAATEWRQGPAWAYKTVRLSDTSSHGGSSGSIPGFIQLHPDVWVAYEWNYHRTARVIMHEQLLDCLNRFDELSAEASKDLLASVQALKDMSVAIIKDLVDEVLSTVPQSLGEVDHEGNPLNPRKSIELCQGVGGYLLLWPIKIMKETRSADAKQRAAAQAVFEHIRECTRMKDVLGEISNI